MGLAPATPISATTVPRPRRSGPGRRRDHRGRARPRWWRGRSTASGPSPTTGTNAVTSPTPASKNASEYSAPSALGHGETAGADLGPQAVQRRGEPVGTVVEGHVTAGDHRPGGRQPADLHGRGPPRAFAQQRLQGDATAARVSSSWRHALQVDEDGPVAAGLVGRLQQLAHLFDRHLQVPEAADGLGGAHLVHRGSAGSRCRSTSAGPAGRRRGSTAAPSRSGRSSWRTARC